jgi:hypothetical protein
MSVASLPHCLTAPFPNRLLLTCHIVATTWVLNTRMAGWSPAFGIQPESWIWCEKVSCTYIWSSFYWPTLIFIQHLWPLRLSQPHMFPW